MYTVALSKNIKFTGKKREHEGGVEAEKEIGNVKVSTRLSVNGMCVIRI